MTDVISVTHGIRIMIAGLLPHHLSPQAGSVTRQLEPLDRILLRCDLVTDQLISVVGRPEVKRIEQILNT